MEIILKTVLIALFLVIPVILFAQDTVEPLYPDFNPGDGFFEPGSPENPYIIKGPSGRRKGKMVPRFPDIVPGDGFFDPGSPENPWTIEWDAYPKN